MATYTKIAARGAAVVLLVSGIAAIMGYLVRLVLARNLTVAEFGLFYAIFALLSFISLFKSLGFDKALAKFIPQFLHEKNESGIKNVILYAIMVHAVSFLFFVLLIILLSDYLSIHFFKDVQASSLLKIMAVAFFIDGFVVILKYCMQGFRRMVLFSGIELVRMVLLLSVIYIGIKLQMGILSPIIAYTLVPIVLLFIFGTTLVWRVFPQFTRVLFHMDKKQFVEVGRYSFFTVLTGTGALVIAYTDSIMLTYFSGVSAVALYNVAFPTAKLLMYIPNAIGAVLWPLTSELWSKKSIGILSAGMQAAYKYSLLVCLPITLILVSFSELIIVTLFGNDYVAAADTLKVLSVGMLFIVFYLLQMNFFSGIGKPELMSKILYVGATINLIGNFILIPFFDILGAAIATSVSYFIMMIIGFITTKRFIAIDWPLFEWCKVIVAGLVVLGSIFLLKMVVSLPALTEAFVIASSAGLLYVALLFALRIISIAELKDLYKRIIK